MSYHEHRTLAMKALRSFIADHPEGVTHKDIKAAGLSTWGLDRLKKLGAIKGTQVKEPKHGPRAYHWLYKISPMKNS